MNAKDEIQSVITELYAIISGPAGHQPNWKREAELYLPSATMLRTTIDPEGHPQATIMPAAEYPQNFEKLIAGRAFHEVEVHNIIEVFGNIAHAFSTYEAWGDADKTVFLKRGINSIQFFFDGANWKVVSMIWDDERPGLSMDRKYLTQDSKTMPKYLKRHWNEGRGDEYNSWGACWWFLEVDANGEVTRQAELYENGRLLRYSAAHPEDEFGALAEVSIDTSDVDYAEMSQGDFEKIWSGS